MKIMISQPMKGKTNEEIRDERKELVEKLTQKGHQVIDTIIDDFIDGKGDDYAIKCLAKSIEYIADVDAVVFMPGWENARGCRVEYIVARDYGKFINDMGDVVNE